MSNKKSHIEINPLDQIKKYKKFDSDTELAKYLGRSQSTVANWRSRDTYDTDLIISKCDEEGLNLNWVFLNELPVERHQGTDIVKEVGEIYDATGISKHIKREVVADLQGILNLHLPVENKMDLLKSYIQIMRGENNNEDNQTT